VDLCEQEVGPVQQADGFDRGDLHGPDTVQAKRCYTA
jgi:hypothetical protein